MYYGSARNKREKALLCKDGRIRKSQLLIYSRTSPGRKASLQPTPQWICGSYQTDVNVKSPVQKKGRKGERQVAQPVSQTTVL